MPKYSSQLASSFFTLIMCALLILLSACSLPFAGASSGPQGNADHGDGKLVISSPVAITPTPQVSTSCPAAGTARAAVMPALQLGTHQAIVYYHNTDNQMVLSIFDVQKQAASSILRANEQIQGAQVSADGQWVLMVISSNNISALQLVRIDGQFLQTIYCALTGQQIGPDAQWSPNQKRIVFSLGNNFNFQTLYLLQLAGGPVQMEVSSGSENLYLATWLDNTRVYFSSVVPHFLYLLDTSKGPNQRFNDIQVIRGGASDATWDFDTSVDGKTLYMSNFAFTTNNGMQAEIDASSVNGGTASKKIFLATDMAIEEVRVINSSSLAFVVFTQSGVTQSQANNFGWWKINIDGSGLTHLNRASHEPAAGPGQWGPFSPSGQYTWSNFSRNGAFYADGLFYGSLTGGSLMRYAANGEGNGNVPVGWTTI